MNIRPHKKPFSFHLWCLIGELLFAMAAISSCPLHEAHAALTADYKAASYRVWIDGEGGGSGVGIGPHYILTNSHVVNHRSGDWVIIGSGRGERFSGHCICHDDARDMAIIQVADREVDYMAVASGDLAVGDDAWEFGFGPSGIINERSGKVTEVGRYKVEAGGVPIVAFSFPVEHGDSGSGVFNSRGEIAGVIFAVDGNSAQGIGIEELRSWIPSLERSGYQLGCVIPVHSNKHRLHCRIQAAISLIFVLIGVCHVERWTQLSRG